MRKIIIFFICNFLINFSAFAYTTKIMEIYNNSSIKVNVEARDTNFWFTVVPTKFSLNPGESQFVDFNMKDYKPSDVPGYAPGFFIRIIPIDSINKGSDILTYDTIYLEDNKTYSDPWMCTEAHENRNFSKFCFHPYNGTKKYNIEADHKYIYIQDK